MTPEQLAIFLGLVRPLVFLDIESTVTVDMARPDPKTDRIVQLAVSKIYPDGKVTYFKTKVNPGIPIARSSSEIHGIGDADVVDAPTFDKIGRVIAIGLGDCDLAGYNARRYDRRLFKAECARHGVTYDDDGVQVVDLYLLWASLEPRDMAAWFKRFTGLEQTSSHDAGDDVAQLLVGLPGMFEAFPDLPRTVPELAKASGQEDKDPNAIDPDGKFKWRGGEPYVCFGKHDGQPMKAVDRGYWRYMLRQDFGPECEKLAREALEGRYPTRDLLPLEDGPTTP